MSEVGRRLKEERDKARLTQVQVSVKTGINNKTLSGYENGVSSPDYESLKILADFYRVTTDYLLGVENESYIEETETDRLRKIAAGMLQRISSPEDLNKAIDHLDYLESKKK